MKRSIALFFAVFALSAALAAPEDKVDFKKCFKQCMKELDNQDKCTYICDDSNDEPAGKDKR